ncbi:MAG: phage holin family protein [Thermoanaerobaculia bacterium]|jgi:cytochrome c biogenesis protein CcdA|nr:phage holin family protein [Thermoanaerobaculia bacterium]
MTSPAGWLARLQQLGSAYFAVLRAEATAALQDLSASGRSLLRAALLFTVTVALGFWTVGLLVYFLIEMLALWLPRWGAVGIVFALFVLGTAAFAAAAVARARRIEAPTAMLERRLRDHAAWWQGRIGGDEEGSGSASRLAVGPDDAPNDGDDR